MILEIPFNVGDLVFADDDDSLRMTVTAVQWRGSDRFHIECSYFADAAAVCCWVESWRLNLWVTE